MNNATPAQVAPAWSMAKGHAAIPPPTRRGNLAANLGALARGERLVSPDFGPAWDR